MPNEARSKHTPLTVLDGYDPPIVGWERDDGDHHVAEIVAQPDDADTDRFAHLFAAAPDLLAACKAALNTPAMNADEMDPIEIEAVELARAAIAKAEGRE